MKVLRKREGPERKFPIKICADRFSKMQIWEVPPPPPPSHSLLSLIYVEEHMAIIIVSTVNVTDVIQHWSFAIQLP